MAIKIDKAGVRRALERWFIAARAGETMSARETAELSSLDAAAASNDFFYQLMAEEGETVNDSVPQEDTFVVGEDLVVGQLAVVGENRRLVAFAPPDEPAQQTLPLEDPAKSDDVSEFF